MRERDIKRMEADNQPRERSESEIRREIAIKRAEIEEISRRNAIYMANRHKLDVSMTDPMCTSFIMNALLIVFGLNVASYIRLQSEMYISRYDKDLIFQKNWTGGNGNGPNRDGGPPPTDGSTGGSADNPVQ